ncbi:MAG: putative rRNA maturation factor [Candidatus Collierbacteria bacterium GW2011_GWA1_42_60]|nr:MAG: putative rRNA maturation factor [Candidatus Collierbacteria bacterium GW2011_GWA1_42_60]
MEEQEITKGAVKISLSVVGERKIRELEKKYFHEDKVTDVLSFPLEEGVEMPDDFDGLNLGDIVICYPQAKRQAIPRPSPPFGYSPRLELGSGL